MTEGITFDEDMADAMERLYATPSMSERRRWIRDRLGVAPGDRVLSIGTGPGFEARGLAEAVGPEGRVLGVDVEEAMLSIARERCADYPWVTFERGDATDLPVEDGAFDAATAVQVLEYVPDLEAAFAELSRVLRPGGRAAVFDSDWSTLTWHAEDDARSDRVVSAFDAHCPHPRLARTIEPRLEAAGFDVVDRDVYVHLDTEMGEASVGEAFVPLLREFVTSQGGIDQREADAWAADVRARAEAGESFFSFNQYLFVGEKPETGP